MEKKTKAHNIKNGYEQNLRWSAHWRESPTHPPEAAITKHEKHTQIQEQKQKQKQKNILVVLMILKLFLKMKKLKKYTVAYMKRTFLKKTFLYLWKENKA